MVLHALLGGSGSDSALKMHDEYMYTSRYQVPDLIESCWNVPMSTCLCLTLRWLLPSIVIILSRIVVPQTFPVVSIFRCAYLCLIRLCFVQI